MLNGKRQVRRTRLSLATGGPPRSEAFNAQRASHRGSCSPSTRWQGGQFSTNQGGLPDWSKGATYNRWPRCWSNVKGFDSLTRRPLKTEPEVGASGSEHSIGPKPSRVPLTSTILRLGLTGGKQNDVLLLRSSRQAAWARPWGKSEVPLPELQPDLS